MKKITKKLMLIITILIIIKIMLSSLVLSPSAFSDEYTYSKMARSFFYYQDFTIHEDPTKQYLPLYPMVLSISYLFQNMQIIYFVMKIINAILSSLILIPSFLLAKEFISEKRALITALTISLYPSNFSFSHLIMAENLYYPLFLLTIYLIYKAFTECRYKWDILSGISIGLTILTKINGIILIPVIAILYIYIIKRREFKLKKAFLIGISFIIVMLPWILRNTILFGFSINSIFGNYSAFLEKTTFSFHSFLIWLIMYLGIVIISVGFIFPLLNLINFKDITKDKRLTVFRLIIIPTIILTIALAANANAHSAFLTETLLKWITWRPLTRTIDVIMPLILINGIINLNNLHKIKNKIFPLLIIPSLILLVTTQIMFFQLFPFNNMSLILLGIMGYITKILFNNQVVITLIFLFLFIAILFLIYYLCTKNKINFNTAATMTILFFFISNILNYGLITYNANTYWYENEQMQIGIWFNNYDKGKSNVLIDKRNEGKILKVDQVGLYENTANNNTVTKIGFFMNNKILIGEINNPDKIDYIISENKLGLPIVKNEGNKIFIYKV